MSNNSDSNWPPELDAITAAPEHHKLLFENDFVRVIDTRILSGETTRIHTHRWPSSLYVLSWSDFKRYDEKGNVVLDSRALPVTPQPGTALWSEPLTPHSLENTGTGEIHIISVEVKG